MSTSLLTVVTARPSVAVIGVGNALMSDDAFGPAMIRALEADKNFRAYAEEVDFVDAGTAGFDLMHHLLGRTEVILLDAVGAVEGEVAGAVRVIPHDTLLAMRHAGARGSAHEPGVVAALQVAALAGALPRVTLIGVVPQSLEMGTTLSPAVRTALPQVRALVLDLLRNALAASTR